MTNPKFSEQRLDDTLAYLKDQDIEPNTALNLQKRIKIAVNNEAKLLAKNEQPSVKTSERFLPFFLWFKVKSVYWGSSAFALTVLSFILVMGGSTAPAFAKVQQQLSAVTSLFYKSEMSIQQQPIMSLSVWFREPGLIRVETTPLTPNGEQAKTINVLDSVNGQGLIMFPAAMRAMTMTFDNDSLNNPKQNPLHWFDLVKNYQGEVVELDQRLVENQWLNGFLIQESELSIIVWSSPETYLPVEISIFDGDSVESSQLHISGQIQYNQVDDAQLFSLQVPDGYQLNTEGTID